MKMFASPRAVRFMLVFTLVVLPSVLMASAGASAETAKPADLIWGMVIKVINFGVLVFFLIKFLSKPLSEYLAARADSIRAGLADLETRRKASSDAAAAYSSRLANIEHEVRKAREEARLEMEREREQVLAEAHLAAQEIISHTQEKIRQEYSKARADLHSEAVALSLRLAEELIVNNISDKDQVRFAEDYIRRIARQ